ncbi:MAG: hypothetical protein JNM72_12800 [Deltaproteobacteria bacterium]|nr:hypothetical protein [Deltaproteobacteria bacterium]
MVELSPALTAAPAGALAALLIAAGAAALRAGGLPRPRASAAAPWLLVCALALVVRLAVLPALQRHEFDGHEAEYWDIFRGERALSRGGTVLYPSVQWLWALLGSVLPHRPEVPVALMAVVGAAGAALAGALVGRRVGGRAGLAAAALVALHPTHAAWSTSAYNVVLPLTLLALATAAVDRCSAGPPASMPLRLVAVAAGGLAVLTRLDVAPGLLFPLLLALHDAREGGLGLRGLLRGWVGPLALTLPVVGLGVYPLVVPGGLPGEGERALSWSMHLLWRAPYAELSGFLAPTGLLLLGGLALLAAPRLALCALVGGVVPHLVLASFDDLGDRHALLVLGPVTLLVGLGVQGRGPIPRGLGALGFGLLAAGFLTQLAALRPRFYGSEEALAEVLEVEVPFRSLPRWSLEAPPPAQQGCTWVTESHRAPPPAEGAATLSHFNLIDPVEAEALRGAAGCLLWVADLQDWRWSSRGVRDRALRLERLFYLRPLALVKDPAAGYPWGVVIEVGPRRCCGAAGLPLRQPAPAGWRTAPRVLP